MGYWFEWLLAIAYGLAGPFAWAVFWFAMLKGRPRMRIRPEPMPALPTPPRVTVVVPCKDEAAHIHECVGSVLGQDWPNLDLIVVNDRSTDGTGDVLDRLAASDSRLSVIHVREGELPAGWWGKTHAMHVGTQAARGDWVIFIDSDCVLAPQAVRTGIVTGEAREFDLVSFVPRFVGTGFWDSLMTPIGGIVTSAMYQLMYANSASVKNVAFACGQYMAVRRGVFNDLGGWAAIRQYPADDVEIARLFKRSGKRPRLGWGMDLVTARMYGDFASIFRGWGRNFIAASRGGPWRVVGGVLFVICCVLSVYPALAWGIYRQFNPVNDLGGVGWLATALVHVAMMTAGLWSSYRFGGNPGRYALLWPLSSLVLLVIFGRSLYLSATGKMDWRGRTYAINPLATQA